MMSPPPAPRPKTDRNSENYASLFVIDWLSESFGRKANLVLSSTTSPVAPKCTPGVLAPMKLNGEGNTDQRSRASIEKKTFEEIPHLPESSVVAASSSSSGCESDFPRNVDSDSSGDCLVLGPATGVEQDNPGVLRTGCRSRSPRQVDSGSGSTASPPRYVDGIDAPPELRTIVVNGYNGGLEHGPIVRSCEDSESQSPSALRPRSSSWAVVGDLAGGVENAKHLEVADQVGRELMEATTEETSTRRLRRGPIEDGLSIRRLSLHGMTSITSRSAENSRDDTLRGSGSSPGSPIRPESRMGTRSPEPMDSSTTDEVDVSWGSFVFVDGSNENHRDHSKLTPSPTRVEQVSPSRIQVDERNQSSPRMQTHGGIECTKGLKNLGNTCYMNSAVQALAHCIQFARFFVRKDYLDHLRDPKRGTLSILFAQLLSRLWRGLSTTKVLKLFLKQIRARCPMYRSSEQQDSHEFLLSFLTLLHEDLNDAPERGTNSPCDVPESVVTTETLAESLKGFIAAHQERERSIVTSNFEGVLVSGLKCLTCEKDSFTFEVFTVLSIPVPSSGPQSDLQACLDEFFKEEILDEWRCPHCNEKRTASKQLRIAKLPRNLIIHLIRCKSEPIFSPMMLTREVNSRVHFTEDLDGRDVAQYLCSKDVQIKSYTLYGIVKHFGISNCGHYVAECRSLGQKGQPWYRYSDDQVTPANYPIDVEDAFMLFYSSVHPRS